MRILTFSLFLLISIANIDAKNKIIFLNFTNQTGSENYQYLSESLKISMHNKMRRRFVFSKVSTRNFASLNNMSRKKKPSTNQLRRVCKKNKAAAVVYGWYSLKKKKILIRPVIYIYQKKRSYSSVRVVARSDSKIFSMVSKSARQLANRAASIRTSQGQKLFKTKDSKKKRKTRKKKKHKIDDNQSLPTKKKHSVEMGPFTF